MTAQQERADKRMKDLHVQMATHTPPTRTVQLKKKDTAPTSDSTSSFHTKLEKMNFK